MNKFVSILKVSIFTSFVGMCCLNLSAYEIKHGYSADNGMEYYGTCNNGKDLMVLENKDGTYKYEGPSSKGKMKKGADLDKAARKACGENKKA